MWSNPREKFCHYPNSIGKSRWACKTCFYSKIRYGFRYEGAVIGSVKGSHGSQQAAESNMAYKLKVSCFKKYATMYFHKKLNKKVYGSRKVS